jgi:hypothetical protein
MYEFSVVTNKWLTVWINVLVFIELLLLYDCILLLFIVKFIKAVSNTYAYIHLHIMLGQLPAALRPVQLPAGSQLETSARV